MRDQYVFTSESVSEGHPDKVCDQLSDAILDAYLASDPEAKVAVEALVAPKRVVLAGEISAKDFFPSDTIETLVRRLIREIGYNQEGFDWETVEIYNYLHSQSPDINQGVSGRDGREEGAGDQGIMFGFASDETDTFMPAPIYYAHRVLQNLAQARKSGELPGLGPDSKSQISLQYDQGRPVGAEAIVLSTQHAEELSHDKVLKMVEPVIRQSLPEGWMCKPERLLINPTGRFVIGGPVGDAGLTGRKIIVDTYGGAAPHGGGAFSGKDPSKVDRSAAYMARYIAKNIVAAGLAKKCTLQLSYAIGVARPVSVYLSFHGTGAVEENVVERMIENEIDLRPRCIRTMLDLDRPIYAPSAAYGHFGRVPQDGLFTWEKQDLVPMFQQLLGKSSKAREAMPAV